MSSDGKISVEMTIEQAQAHNALVTLIAAQTKSEKGFTKIADETKKLGREQAAAQKELQKFAETLNKIEASPLEKYRAEMTRLKTVEDAGLVSAEKLASARKKVINEFIKHSIEIEKNSSQLTKSNTIAEKNATATGEIASKGNKAFGSESVAMIARYASGLLGVGAVINELRNGMQRYDEESKKALSNYQSVRDSNASFAQLAGGDEEKYKAMLKERDALAVKYAIDPNVASRALFQSISGNFNEKEKQTVFQAGEARISPDDAARLMLKGKNLFNREGRDVINATIVAAGATSTEVTDVAKYAPKAFVSAENAGFSMEEAVTIVAKMTDLFTGQEQGADRAAALFDKMAINPELKGTGLAGIKRLMQDEAFMRDFAKDDSEKNQVVTAFTKRSDEIQALIENVKKGVSTKRQGLDPLEEMVKLIYSDDKAVNERQLRKNKISADMAGIDTFAGQESARQAYWERTRGIASQEGAGPLAMTALDIAQRLEWFKFALRPEAQTKQNYMPGIDNQDEILSSVGIKPQKPRTGVPLMKVREPSAEVKAAQENLTESLNSLEQELKDLNKSMRETANNTSSPPVVLKPTANRK